MDQKGINSLSVASFNCQGAMRSSLYICELLDELDLDILVLCEHWLFPNSVTYLESLNCEYVCHAVCDADLDALDPYKRGKGGVAIMWHKRVDHAVSVITMQYDRIIAVGIELENRKFITIIAVYLPATNVSLCDFQESVDLLSSIYQIHSQYSEVFVLGDLNAQLCGPRCNCDTTQPRTKEL